MASIALTALIVLAIYSPHSEAAPTARPVPDQQIVLAFDEVDPRLAIIDAVAARQRGDLHLLGIYGYSRIVPGAASLSANRIVFFIEGTSDHPGDRQEVEFNRRAAAYALAYNQTILATEVAVPGSSPKDRTSD